MTQAELLEEIERLRHRVAVLERQTREQQGGSDQVDNLRVALTEALEQQTATSEILRVISQSPTDGQPVFDAIVQSATRLCDAAFGAAFRFDGQLQTFVAHHNVIPSELELLREHYPRPATRGAATGRAIVDRRIIHISDTREDPEYTSPTRQALGWRTVLAAPMLRDGEPIGALGLWRREVRPFTDKQIALLQTFADQAVIAVENVRLFNETKDALERQTATSEILRVISTSPADIQPVFDVIAGSARRLCEAADVSIFRLDGDRALLVAHDGSIASSTVGEFAIPLEGPMRRLAESAQIFHVADLQAKSGEFPEIVYETARRLGFRAVLGVPLLREGVAIGSINLRRREAQLFTARQISLLQTFADQAVIAIENVRLFKELEARNRDLTATSEILRVIAGSPTDVQPVFDSLVESAARLCDGTFATLATYDGDLMYLVAAHNWTPAAFDAARRFSPARPSRALFSGRAILERSIVHVPDVELDPEFMEGSRDIRDAVGFRSSLMVPMLRDGMPVGVIGVGRAAPGLFSDSQIALLRSFADQAVIAIENVRLFKELQEKNQALTRAHAQVTEALEQQTATSEILRVISSSPTDIQPVFNAIAHSAVSLCEATFCTVFRFDGELLHFVAHHGLTPEGVEAVHQAYPMAPGRGSAAARSVLSGAVEHIPDVHADPDFQHGAIAKVVTSRSYLAVPMLRDDVPIGSLVVLRSRAEAFPDRHIELLKTFADQAVIAIENVRLFNELRTRTHELTRSVDQLTALGDVGRALSSTLDLDTVLRTIVARAVQLSGTNGGIIYEYDETGEIFQVRAAQQAAPEHLDALAATPLRLGEGALGRAAATGGPVEVEDIRAEGAPVAPQVRHIMVRLGYRSVLAVPLLREGRILGGLVVWRRESGRFPADAVSLLQTFATQSALAIQNARLFREIEEKSRALEAASQHKSEFLASMSHELRTPLNGILGFNEMILDSIYGEVPPELREPLTEIQNSGRHLLRLINNVLDLSKIEAGRMELALGDYAVQDTVAQVRASLHSLAADKGLEFVTAVPADLQLAHGDAGRITQCLTNLAGNAIKFTRQGRVEIAVELQGELLVYRVSDTGIGIEPDRIGTLFSEFRQADATIASEFGGSGLGLSITRKFAEMHGGRVWVESEAGKGSSFFLAVPLRVRGGAPA